MTNDLYIQTLLDKTLRLVKKLKEKTPEFLSSFYLSGGTGLSLQIGHRTSEDLDFFNQDEFKGQNYQQEFEHIGSLEHVELDASSLNAFMDGVKIQLLHYPYKLLEQTIDWEGLRISSKVDIACTKLLTVSQRGSKKDFVDMYFLLKEYSLEELLAKLDEKYSGVDYNKLHILKSLTYFTDAETQPMPRMLVDASWDKIKQSILNSVKTTPIE